MKDTRSQVVALAVIVDARRLLVVRRVAPEGSLSWVMPGGKVEAGETAEGAAAREALEETGVVVEARHVLGERIHPDTDRRVVYVACEFVSGVATIGNAREVSEVAWVGSAELGVLIPHGLFEPVQEYLASALET